MGYRIDGIDPRCAALLVIDMQNDFLLEGAPLEVAQGRAMMPVVNGAIAAARASGMPVLFTRHAHNRDGTDMGMFARIYPAVAERTALIDGTPGTELYADLDRSPEEPVLAKTRYSAFHGTDLRDRLAGVRTLVLCGVTTEDCVQATARDAMFLDFEVLVLSDAAATYDHPDAGQGGMSADEVHAATLVVLAQSTADVRTAEEFARLCGGVVGEPVVLGE
ncbi:cysteine hydrolase family protein [Sciscionella sediminilitoris]|uniref:cysteine hydrolase family protein n=1 Tax=Sciscionella sediminilitoris TaxID=1445613 RepID=UPI0005691447|nr:isochorismatase family cysteine hydrolase [Sciscionella sp. SE31]